MELDVPGRSADRASRIICGLHAALMFIEALAMKQGIN